LNPLNMGRKRILTLGEKLKVLRDNKKLTQEQLSKLAGIPNITLIKIETGKIKNPGIKNLIKIINTLDGSFDELFKINKKKDDED
ncbi:MAG: helix-turn-helix transcriptional regulator, partial [Candidatus Gracilibacteria bacterium]|nr:helix-turn-helix transcriptional regulator [Candidatus Gracilibacteria bacterium]